MFAQARTILSSAAVALLAATSAVALTPQVEDRANLFSTSTVEKANRMIEEIKDHYGKDLLIESFPSVPGDRAETVQRMDRSERERFFDEWARERARQEGVHGVYVLICKEPGHVEVEVDNETRQRAFTVANRDHLRDLLVRAFKARQYDRGLLDGVQYVRDAMKANLGERGRAHPEGGVPSVPDGDGGGLALGAGVLGLLCLGMVGLLAVTALILGRRRTGRPGYSSGIYGPGGYGPRGGYGAPAPGYGRGGGFLSNMVGGLFGAAAGNWVYDHLFRGGSSNYGGYSGAPPASGPDTDYSGAGGDFNAGGPSDQSGGDFSGGALGSGDFYEGRGDFGGGDFSGRDTGSGGDF